MQLWFDVEKKTITTVAESAAKDGLLWFDVEKKTITTTSITVSIQIVLWFDVEKKTITTRGIACQRHHSCGLMQKKKQ